MIHQLNVYGKDKVQTAIERIKTFEPPEGYYLAFSGGKDSVVVKALVDMAKVKHDTHYALTTVDPPELVQFIKKEYPDTVFDRQYRKDGRPYTMWNLIPEKLMPPTRIVRYCCQYLKEGCGQGRFTITGVRKAESVRRQTRGGLELSNTKTKRMDNYDPDNPDQELIHTCQTYTRRTLNPIIDWTDQDVWEFIHEYNIPYCKLYDEGYKRLGCIGCPMSTHRAEELEKYPKYKQAYINAFDKMLKVRRDKGIVAREEWQQKWKTGEDVMKWWINERSF